MPQKPDVSLCKVSVTRFSSVMTFYLFIYVVVVVVALTLRDHYTPAERESTFSCVSKRRDATPFYLLEVRSD